MRYRDTDTGRFVAESTYNRSVSHGGTRYEPVDFPTAAPPEPPPEDRTPEEFQEFEDYYYGGEEAAEEAEY